MAGYRKIKFPPLTDDEISARYGEAKEEMKEVLDWKKEEEARLSDEKSKPQAKSAAKRALKKVERRLNTVKGNILYWKLRTEGKSHFNANLERNEFWASQNNLEKED